MTHLARLAVIVVLMLVGCESEKGQPARPVTSNSACPVDGQEESARLGFLKKHDLQGRVTLVQFGIAGSPSSDSGLDDMISLDREEAIPQLRYVRVEMGKDGALVRQYYAAKSPPFAVHEDPKAVVANAFDATVYPAFVLVDKFGRVRARGKLPGEGELLEWVKTLLAETSDAGPDVTLFGTQGLDVPVLLAGTKLPELNGQVAGLGGHMGPRGLLAVFLDTTCPFSGTALADVPTVANKLAKHKINTVLINLDDAEDSVRQYYAKHEVGGVPVLYDVTTKTKDRWEVRSVPTLVFIDKGETLAYKGKALWGKLAVPVENKLGLGPGSLQFGVTGTGFG